MPLVPFVFEAATLLATLAHPSHLVFLSFLGFAPLPPRSNFKSIGYMTGHPIIIIQFKCIKLKITYDHLTRKTARHFTRLLTQSQMTLINASKNHNKRLINRNFSEQIQTGAISKDETEEVSPALEK